MSGWGWEEARDLRRLRNQEAEFEKKTAIALGLLKAEPVEGRKVNVILNPSLAGVFTHEAFGHFSEADLIEDVSDPEGEDEDRGTIGDTKR